MKRNIALMINPKDYFFKEKNTEKITVKLILIRGEKKQGGRDRKRMVS